MAAILMTHTDHQRLRDVLDRMTTEDRRHFAALSRTVHGALRMDPTELPPDVVTMDSVVSLDEFGTGDHWVLTLSYPWDADIDENRTDVAKRQELQHMCLDAPTFVFRQRSKSDANSFIRSLYVWSRSVRCWPALATASRSSS